MTVSEQQIEDFIDKECQSDEHGDFHFNHEGLIYLLQDFQKADAFKFDAEAMAKALFEQQEKARLDAFIKHEKEQRRFIAANSAMNGLLANPKTSQHIDSSLKLANGKAKMPPLYAISAVEMADALLAELESTNQSNQQQ